MHGSLIIDSIRWDTGTAINAEIADPISKCDVRPFLIRPPAPRSLQALLFSREILYSRMASIRSSIAYSSTNRNLIVEDYKPFPRGLGVWNEEPIFRTVGNYPMDGTSLMNTVVYPGSMLVTNITTLVRTTT
jgi:hypothetical protein